MRAISPAVHDEINEYHAAAGEVSPLRRSLMDDILRINRSATTDFLSRFGDKALRTYLDHLEATLKPRGRDAVWVRPGDTAAVNTLEPAW